MRITRGLGGQEYTVRYGNEEDMRSDAERAAWERGWRCHIER